MTGSMRCRGASRALAGLNIETSTAAVGKHLSYGQANPRGVKL